MFHPNSYCGVQIFSHLVCVMSCINFAVLNISSPCIHFNHIVSSMLSNDMSKGCFTKTRRTTQQCNLTNKKIFLKKLKITDSCTIKNNCSRACYCTGFTASQHHYKPCAPDGQMHQFPGIKNIVPLIKRQVIVQRSLQLQLALIHCVLTTTYIVYEIRVISCRESTCD